MRDCRYPDFAERFKTLLATYAEGKGQTEIANLLGTPQSIISRMKNGVQLPPDSVMERIRELWGVDMVEDVRRMREENRYNTKGRKRATPNEIKSRLGVPYYDSDFEGGFDDMYSDNPEVPAYFINCKPYDNATCWCSITGHSMEPEISHGDMIALKRIPDWSFLIIGEVYAIITKNDMRTVKRIGRGSTDETYLLIPTNKSPEYSPQEVRKSDIREVFRVVACLKKL